jgi:hypothetical protein
LAAAGGIEADAFALSYGLDGDYVPDVFGDYVGHEEIYLFTRIDFPVGSGGFDAVAVFGEGSGGFDLDSEQSAAEVDYGVIALAVSPGDADAAVEGGGSGEEGGLGGFSAALAGGGAYGLEGDYFWSGGLLLRIVGFLPHKLKKAQPVAAPWALLC